VTNKLEYLGAIGTPGSNGPPPIPAHMLRVRGRVARAMIAVHALAPEQAVLFRPEAFDEREFKHLVNIGVLRETIRGHFWLDLVAFHLREQSRARARAFILGTGALFIGLAMMLLYRLT
jgi:hypothetical protein